MENSDEVVKELKAIHSLLEQKPAPAPPKGMYNEFKAFLSQYKVLGLAVAFIIGLYLGTLVQSMVKDLLMPTIGLAVPGLQNLSTLTYLFRNQQFALGDFLIALITFLIVIAVIFVIVKVTKRSGIE